MKLAGNLMLLRDGAITFDEFERRTRPLWHYMSARLVRVQLRGFRVLGVGEEDVRQEMLLAAWVFTGKWDPRYGVEIDRYVIFNANDKAKKWLLSQAKRRDGKIRAPKLGERNTIEQEPAFNRMRGVVEQRVSEGFDLSELPHKERVVVEALIATRNAHAAALYIYNHYPSRLEFKLGCEQASLRMVRAVAERLCNDAGDGDQQEDE